MQHFVKKSQNIQTNKNFFKKFCGKGLKFPADKQELDGEQQLHRSAAVLRFLFFAMQIFL